MTIDLPVRPIWIDSSVTDAKALIVYAGAHQGDRAVAAEANGVIDEIVSEYATPAVGR